MIRFWKARASAREGSWYGMLGPEFQTMRLILQWTPFFVFD